MAVELDPVAYHAHRMLLAFEAMAVALVLIAAGISIWAAMKAEDQNHTPIEEWVNRSVFGATTADETGNDTRMYRDQNSEMVPYYAARYAPVLLNEQATKEIVGEQGGSEYFSRNWIASIFKGRTPDVATWYILPDYDISISDHRANVGEKTTLEYIEQESETPTVLYDSDDVDATIVTDAEHDDADQLEPITVTAKLPWQQSFWLTEFGLVARLVKTMDADSPRPIHANIAYRPNLGFDPRMSTNKNFVLGN